jgi:DNA-binding MarR family transcriptional regulator
MERVATVPATGWLTDDEQRVWRSLLDVHGRLIEQLDRDLLERHGLALGDYEVLVALSEAPEHSMRMAELASRLSLSPSGLTRRVDGLVKDGSVSRRSCPSDRRGSLAELTPKGLDRLVRAAPTHVAGVRRYLFDPLSSGNLAHLAAGLEAISDALDSAG